MQKNHYLFSILMSLFILSSMQTPIKGDWGQGDCSHYHGITYHYARYIENPEIIFDGIANQSESWNRSDVYEYTIPMVNRIDSSMRFKSYMHIKYIYDDVNLYILARWNDSSPIDRLDQLYFCWNMNCTNFTVSMFLDKNAMVTNEEGARVDCWKWLRLGSSNGSIFNLVDECYDSEDWIDGEENRDPIAFYTSGIEKDGKGYYQVELKRSLLTNEKNVDVQFKANTSIRFSTGVGDGMGSNEHAVSWTHELDLNNGTDSFNNNTSSTSTTDDFSTNQKINGYNTYYIGVISVIFWGVIILKNIQKRRKIL
ncbi:hypothetical protein [Candidatus Lokiarchaeum ossiferum]|uniref:hypothetical protein n=1 Tax=Candidatus Lokiarchaeum ossiferum TaxID=2951803 RepID=UPI00352FABB9